MILSSMERMAIGLVMVKPHGVSTGLDVVVSAFLNGEADSSLESRLNLDVDEIRDFTRKSRVVRTLYRNLGDGSASSRRVFDIFYHRQVGEKCYPTMVRQYLAPAIFYLLRYDGEQNHFNDLLKRIKGFPTLISESDQVIPGYGLRGALVEPSQRATADYLDSLDGDRYQTAILSVVENVIHSTNNINETSLAVMSILNPMERVALQIDNPQVFNMLVHHSTYLVDQSLSPYLTTLA